MGDIPIEKTTGVTRIAGRDEAYLADVELQSGKRRLLTDAVVTVEELFGQDMLPDSWTRILTAVNGTYIQLSIYGFTNWNIPVNTTDVNTAAADAVTWLNSQSSFNTAFIARKVKDNPIIHVQSKYWGEWGERQTYSSTGTGGTTTEDGFGDVKVRGKATSLSFDVRDPRVGILGITGSVIASQAAASDIILGQPKNGTSENLNVNGSATPVEFIFPAIASESQYITAIRYFGHASGVKFGQFLSINTVLSNGIRTIIKGENQVKELPLIKETGDFQGKFNWDGTFQLLAGAGPDSFVATLKFSAPIVIKKIGTYPTDDYIKVIIQDNLSTIGRLQGIVLGYQVEE